MWLTFVPAAETYFIVNAKWGGCLVGRETSVGVYSGPAAEDWNDQCPGGAVWKLKPDDQCPEYYNIFNLKSPGNYLYSGFKYDGKVYESGDFKLDHAENYRWKLQVLQQESHASTVSLTDKAHNKALVAGSRIDDGDVYHQDFTTDAHARWSFVLVDLPK